MATNQSQERCLFTCKQGVLYSPYHFIKSLVAVISQLFLAVLPDVFEFSQTLQGTISANSQPLSTSFFKREVFDTIYSAGDLSANKASRKCRHFFLGCKCYYFTSCLVLNKRTAQSWSVFSLWAHKEGRYEPRSISHGSRLSRCLYLIPLRALRDLDAFQGRRRGASSRCQRSFHSHK